MKAARKKRESFGRVDKRRNGRRRARYIGPDKVLYAAPETFATLAEARAWLVRRQVEIADGTWVPPEELATRREKQKRENDRRNVTLAEYAEQWIATRTNSRGEPIRIRTADEYRRMLRAAGTRSPSDKGGPLAPLVVEVIGTITPAQVRRWRTNEMERGTKTQTSRAYDLLKSIMKTAVEDRVIDSNPCNVRGGSVTKTGKKVEPPTDQEMNTILRAMDVRYRALLVMAAVGGLRWGEVTELRAKDVAIERAADGSVDCVRLNVQRQVIKPQRRERVVAEVKSAAGVRSVAIFGREAEIVAEQVGSKSGNALLTTNAKGDSWLPQASFWRHWHKAVVAAGRPDLPLHGLRHFAGTRYAQAGATVKETMDRLGHSSPKAAMGYQHSGNRDDELARRLAPIAVTQSNEPG